MEGGEGEGEGVRSIGSALSNSVDAMPHLSDGNDEHSIVEVGEQTEGSRQDGIDDEEESIGMGSRRRRIGLGQNETDTETQVRKIRRISSEDDEGSDVVDVEDNDDLEDGSQSDDQQPVEILDISQTNAATADGTDQHQQQVEQNGSDGNSDEGNESEDLKVLTEEDQIRAQQVIEVDDENDSEVDYSKKSTSEMPLETKKAADYVCPICMEPPEAALVTKCGHIFCTTCLYGMINSSKGNGRKNGLCALCRENVRPQELRLVIMRKQRIRKPN
ncbi:hypothetical protein C6P43_001408 [Kluyveromyces marxianus]|nr:hypothetical protein C6P43_001408 [Kluyveromyces marxianus]